MNKKKFRVVIPAGGRSSRSGLDYPKSLYRVEGIPILVRLCQLFKQYDQKPLIIINPANEKIFKDVLNEFNIQTDFVFQHEPSGMGNALLQAEEHIGENEEIILVWSDIPFLAPETIRHMIDCHIVCNNNFSFITALCESCYTIVVRKNGIVKAVTETRAAGISPGKNGEREIGLFVFKKNPLFSRLKEPGGITDINGKKEHGFLYIIEKLVDTGCKVEGYPLAIETDLLSFNTPEDLKQIITFKRQSSVIDSYNESLK